MKILVDRLQDSPTELAFEETSAWRAEVEEALPELRGSLTEPIRASLRAHRMGLDVYLEGALRGALDLECSRCLARYREPLLEPFRLVLSPAGSRVPAEPEAAVALDRYGLCLADELETGWFQGHEIDLSGLFQEIVTLALPVQPLCRDDCKGLCPRCGADRNAGPCGCAESRPHSPFAVLGSLRTRGDS